MIAIANFLGGGILLLIGLYLRLSKDSVWLIAGYNTMSKTEKAKWNEAAMRRFIGLELIIISSVLVIAGVLALLEFYPLIMFISSWSIFLVMIISCLIYLNRSPKFKV